MDRTIFSTMALKMSTTHKVNLPQIFRSLAELGVEVHQLAKVSQLENQSLVSSMQEL